MHDVHKDYQGAKLGMWLFLFTEIILFGGLFVLYAVYLADNGPAFHAAGKELSVAMGGTNTVVLITSSWFVAMAVVALQKGDVPKTKGFLVLTILLAAVFLVVKYFEWSAKFRHGIYPGSQEMLHLPPGEMVFFALYFTMTGLHGLHVVAGMAVLGWVLRLVSKGRAHQRDFVVLENAGLYWHLVDLIWIYLFPLFYLIA